MISVIIPVYNAEKYLKRCLDSLVGQTMFEEMELVIINDGSTDKSEEIISSYTEHFSNIIGRKTENGGVSSARNIGLEIASGDLITFVDADDYVDDIFIENMYKVVDAGTDIVCSGFMAEYPDGKVVRHSSHQECMLEKMGALSAFLEGGELEPNVTDKLFRRDLIGDTRFNVQYDIAEDKYFLFECLQKITALKMVPCFNYHYVMSEGSACRKQFTPGRFQSLAIAERIRTEVGIAYPQLLELAEVMEIIAKCRVYGDICRWNVQSEYPEEYRRLQCNIRGMNVWRMAKYSSRKHTLAFLAAKVSPRLYNLLKYGLKLQYTSLFSEHNRLHNLKTGG